MATRKISVWDNVRAMFPHLSEYVRLKEELMDYKFAHQDAIALEKLAMMEYIKQQGIDTEYEDQEEEVDGRIAPEAH